MRAVESFVEERRSETARTRMVTGARETRIAHGHGDRNEREDRFEDRDIGLVREGDRIFLFHRAVETYARHTKVEKVAAMEQGIRGGGEKRG